MSGLIDYPLFLLRGITERIGLPATTQVARRPGVQVVYRVTVHYRDGRACDSVATLVKSVAEGVRLEIHYQNALEGKPLTPEIPPERYEDFVQALQNIGFDQMRDQPDLPNAADLWLVERASGTFVHGVVVAPDSASEQHARLVNAVRNGLPEALRMIT
ncbi:MAG TPA: hypothetical protein VK003_00485 [Oceanobacillus sp.]|nr:hypothetical protein [Oceanobacillus sp.]